MSAERPPWRVKYDGTCARCGRALARGTPAIYERTSRTIRCVDCQAASEPTAEVSVPQSVFDTGIAGASARREYERRRAKREQRVKSRFGDRVGGMWLAVTEDPQSTRAWARGAEGEEILGDVLAGIAGIVVFHDRRVPGTRGNIDHLVIAPAGVFVIDAKRYEGQVRIRDRGSLLRRDDRLFVGRHDCSKLADGLTWQMEAVDRALRASFGDEIPVTAVLCFVGAEWPLLFPPKEFRGVRLDSPRTLGDRLKDHTGVSPIEVHDVAIALASAMPSKIP
jgi:nuclease-like protein